MKKILSYFLIFTIFIVTGTYSGFWFYYKSQIENEIVNLTKQNSNKEVEIVTSSLSTTGFPLPPKTIWSGDIYLKEGINKIIIEIPEIAIEGFMIDNQNIALHLSKGLKIGKDKWESKKIIDEFYIKTTVPPNLPSDINKENIEKWKNQGGNIPVKKLLIRIGDIKLSGIGEFYLDDNLQIAGEMNIEIENAENFVDLMKNNRQANQRSPLIVTTIINAMSETDEKTGKKLIKTKLKIKNRDIYLGMLKIGTNEPIIWD